MRADWEDAPDWIQSRKRSEAWKPMAIAVIGVGVTFGAMLVAGEAFLKRKASTEYENGSLQTTYAPVAQIRREPEAAKDWDRIVEKAALASDEKASQSTGEPGKQTVFNDLNYTPKGAVNVVSYPAIEPEPVKKRTQAEMKVVVVGKPDAKVSDYCPGGEGSIMRRNCKQTTNLNVRNQ